MSPLLSMAIRNVLRNRRRTAITLAALAIGVGAVGSIRGLLNGLQTAIVRGTVEGTVGAMQVHRAGYLANVLSAPLTLDFEWDEALAQKLRAVRGVRAVTPRIQFAGSLTLTPEAGQAPEEGLFLAATALDPAHESEVCPQRGDFFAPGTRFDADHVVLGDALAQAVHAKPEAEAVLLAPDRDGSLNGELSKVGGSMRAIMPGEMKVAVVPLALAQKLLRMEGRVTEVALAVDDLSRVEATAQAVRDVLGPAFEVHTWAELAPERKTIMNIQNGISAVTSAVFVLLMLLGVANTMLMSVLERTREVGTMMAVGVTRQSVALLFLLEAMVLGVSGTALGALLAFAVTAVLGRRGLSITPPNASMPIELFPFLTWPFMAGVTVVAVLGAALFALYPALRASRLRPVEALAGR